MPAVPGTLYFGREDQRRCKMVFVGRVRVRGAEQTAYMLAVPADGTGPRDRRLPLTGGDEADQAQPPGHGYVRLVARRRLQGLQLTRPDAEDLEEWGPQLAPRLDALETPLLDEASHPMDPFRPDEFDFSDDGPETEHVPVLPGPEGLPRFELVPSSPDLPALRDTRTFRPPPRSERARDGEGLAAGVETQRARSALFGQGPLNEETARALLEEVRMALPGPPKRRGGRAGGEAGRQSGAERSGLGATGAGDAGRGESEASSEESRGRGRDRDRDRDRGRRRRRRGSSSSASSSGSRSPKSGRGARKIRTYEKCVKQFERHPDRRWAHIEQSAEKAGYGHAANKVELLVTECTKLGKSKGTCYLAAMVARTGAAAAAGNSKLASGLAAATLGYLDTLYVMGDPEVAFRTTLTADPVAVLRTPTLPKSQAVPETGAKKESGSGFSHRSKFSQLIEPHVLESTLQAGKQWQEWDALTR